MSFVVLSERARAPAIYKHYYFTKRPSSLQNRVGKQNMAKKQALRPKVLHSRTS